MTQIELTPTTSLTGKWKPYPAYKDSGVEWLGEIPEHWGVERLKYSSNCLDAQRIPLNSEQRAVMQGEYPYWGANCIIDYVNEWLFNEELVLLGEDGAPFFDPTKEVAFFVFGKIWVNNHAHILRPKKDIKARFLAYSLNMVDYRAFIDGSTRDKLTQNDMNNIAIQQPPISEQHSITTFLDIETAKINTLIAKKERLIELLHEKRAALISHAVTKGLDPIVPMKDSGVEWLGEIPKHWEARQFKRVAEISYGLTLELDRTETEGTYIISLPNVTKEGQLLLNDVPLTPLTFEEKKKLLLRKGDLLFNWRNGSSDHVGKTAYFDGDGEYTHVSFLLRIRFDSTKYDSRYYQMFLNNLRNTEFFSSAKHRVNKTYNQTELRRLEVMVPPFEEQRMIAAYLDHKIV
jgi:type I restriction enzyme, S subunit